MQTNTTLKSYEYMREIFENELKTCLENLTSVPEPVLSGMRYAMSVGGKRLRPVLAMLTADMLGCAEKKVMPICLAIEFIHNYTLVHDDMPCMDNDELRRGKPTVHVKFGEGMAVLIGDALLNYSVEILAQNANLLGDKLGEILKVLYTNSGATGVIAGQCVDLASENGKGEISESQVKYLHLHKTSCLIKAPIICSAIVSGASESQIQALSDYADNLGLAFQITDDILDIEGDEKTFGKPIGSDVEKGKLTYPAVFGLEKSKELANYHISEGLRSISGFDNNMELSNFIKSVANRLK